MATTGNQLEDLMKLCSQYYSAHHLSSGVPHALTVSSPDQDASITFVLRKITDKPQLVRFDLCASAQFSDLFPLFSGLLTATYEELRLSDLPSRFDASLSNIQGAGMLGDLRVYFDTDGDPTRIRLARVEAYRGRAYAPLLVESASLPGLAYALLAMADRIDIRRINPLEDDPYQELLKTSLTLRAKRVGGRAENFFFEYRLSLANLNPLPDTAMLMVRRYFSLVEDRFPSTFQGGSESTKVEGLIRDLSLTDYLSGVKGH